MKPSEYITSSCVYHAMRTIFGPEHTKWFFSMMSKDSYTPKQCVFLISGGYASPDITYGEFIFTKDLKDYTVKIWWQAVDQKTILTDIYAIKDMEILDAPL
jgi:hypothetical protein